MFRIGDSDVGDDQRPYVIAEVGINARDDIELAKAHISAAAEAGADAVKFQTHLPDEEMHQSEMTRIGAEDVYETIEANEWSIEDHQELKITCEEHDIHFLSTPFSTAAVELLDDLGVPAIKIGSGELRNRQLLDRAGTTGRPLIVSTGMASHETVMKAYRFLSDRVDDFALLYCVSAYPTEPEDIHLSYIDKLRNETGIPIGFSDHSLGIKAPVLSLEHDVSIIEKHFTLDRRLPGPDQTVSITPEELSQLVDFIEYDERTGGSSKPLIEEENDIREWANHSIVTIKNVAAGDALSEKDMTTKRPATGISAERYFDIVGRTAATDIPPETVLTENHLRD